MEQFEWSGLLRLLVWLLPLIPFVILWVHLSEVDKHTKRAAEDLRAIRQLLESRAGAAAKAPTSPLGLG